MERLTIDKPISEMNMVELAHNSCFVKNGEAYYRDFDEEISARDLARRLYKLYTSEELSKDNDTFDVEMMEELQYDIEIYPEGLVALYYRSIWAMADLRERLKKYEDAEEQKTVKNILRNNQWIPVEEKLPDVDKYILVSFENFSVPMIGRYTVDDDDGGTFRVGDEDESFIEHDLYVNAWMPLPESYKN